MRNVKQPNQNLMQRLHEQHNSDFFKKRKKKKTNDYGLFFKLYVMTNS